jgi:cysteinyl-tRNA synthetase
VSEVPSNAAAASIGGRGTAVGSDPLREVRIYDTMRGDVVPLRPLVPPRVGMFVCGLTPYKPSHIGHARTFVFFDTVARFLRELGYRVFYVQNSTDVDDKAIRQAHEEHVSAYEVTERYFQLYLRNMETLGVRSVNLYARTTDYIPEIIDQVKTLVDKGFGYAVEGGDLFFEVAKFPAFGALSRQRVEEVQPGARVEVDGRKRSPEDFAIWKSAKPGEPYWKSPWGNGRPGWHIEDTAITVNVLGPRYDLHGGGAELKFPHHEAEIAQAESATGRSPLAAIWMHAGLLNMRGEKMSKSLGNVEPLDETLRRFSPNVLRFFLLSGLYRSPLDYVGDSSLEEASRSYATLAAPRGRLLELLGDRAPGDDRGQPLPKEWSGKIRAVKEGFVAAMANDFQLREAQNHLFRHAREINVLLGGSEDLSAEALQQLLSPYELADATLGYFSLDTRDGTSSTKAPAELGALVEVLLEARQRARARGDYAEADRLRAEAASAGILIEDTPKGPRWSRKAR